MKKNRLLLGVLILTLVMSLVACSGSDDQGSVDTATQLTVTTNNGDIRGLSEDGVRKFLGVPFAKPPLEDLRFVPPQDAVDWDGILDCTEKKPSALQISDDKDVEYSEDCLYLNVWTPDDASETSELPVLVFIHGGAFAIGSPNLEKYDGTRFAKDGVIQVNIAYRLNGLGFTAFDEVEEEYGYAGNMGQLDQIKGLQWIQDNIASFGGDPHKVTVCGESAGSMSIANLMLADEAKGLFHRTIMQSGTSLMQSVLSPNSDGNKDEAKAMTQKLMESVGADKFEDMQKVDAGEVVNNSAFSIDMTEQTPQYFFPVFDGKLFPENPYDAIVNGKMNDMDIMTGFNTDEGSIFIPENTAEEDYEAYMDLVFGDKSDKVKKHYPLDAQHTSSDRLRQMVKLSLSLGSQVYGDALSERGNNVFLYEYAYTTDFLEGKALGAHHGMELEFVFDTLSSHLQDQTSERVKEDIHQMWLNFIVDGDPNGDGKSGIHWPLYNSDDKKFLKIDVKSSAEKSPLTEDLEFMKSILWE